MKAKIRIVLLSLSLIFLVTQMVIDINCGSNPSTSKDSLCYSEDFTCYSTCESKGLIYTGSLTDNGCGCSESLGLDFNEVYIKNG